MIDEKTYLHKIQSNTCLTTFQKKVLKVTFKIPRGQVRSYKWVSERAGSKAYRAVGQALSKNPYAPHVPCHRVIASDGTIGGYSGGLDKKRRLLREEGIVIGE